MSQQSCQPPFAPCTQYPLCSRTCLSQTSITDACKDPNAIFARDCTCGRKVGYKNPELITLYFKGLFECVKKECVEDEERGNFLETYQERCLVDISRTIAATYIPSEFAKLLSTTSIPNPPSTSTTTSRSTTRTTTTRDPSNSNSTSSTSIPNLPNPTSSTPNSASSPAGTDPGQTSPNTTNTTISPTSTASDPPRDLSNGALAGISVGAAIIGILIAGIAAVIAWKQYKFAKSQRQVSGQNVNVNQVTKKKFFWQKGSKVGGVLEEREERDFRTTGTTGRRCT